MKSVDANWAVSSGRRNGPQATSSERNRRYGKLTTEEPETAMGRDAAKGGIGARVPPIPGADQRVSSVQIRV